MTRSELCQRFLGTLPIRTRDARVVRLAPWPSQQKVLTEIVLPRLEKKEKVWLIILKARRLGMSTLMEALMLWRAVEQDYVMSMVIAHEVPATKRIWQMTKLMVTHHPVLSKVGKVVGNSISFQHSLLDVATAGSPAASRSADFTCLHLSEVAFWPHPEAMLAALQCVPEAFQSFVAIESTANGKVGDGELFYDEWRRAVEGDSDFVPIFLPWYEFPDYQKPPSSIFFDTALDAEEQALQAEFKLSDAQLAWRRYCIATKCQGEVEKFHQEYPSTAEEAFIQSGLPFFGTAQLLPLHKQLRAGTRCRLDETGRLIKDPTGPLEVFRFPEAGHQYVIGADPSMGVEDSDRSRSAACILDMETQEQVAEYDSPAAPHVFAKHLCGMGRAYHDALICPEVQSSGGGGGREVVVYLKEQLNYWNLHIWRHADRIRRERGVLYGWECVDPKARMLTEDLRWVEADSVKVGDRLLGCRESTRGNGTGVPMPLRMQTVTHRALFLAPRVAVTLADGRQTCVSTTHPFWTQRGGQTQRRWITAKDLRPGDVLNCLPLWETLWSYEAGRLSAFLDGEGHLAQGRRYGYQMLISQAEGPLAEEIHGLWAALGFRSTFKWLRHKKRPHEKPVATCGVIRLPDVLRALGSLRPSRLLRKFAASDIERLTLRSFHRVAVTQVRSLSEGPVIGLTTSPDHTLIADGIVGHNTNARTRPRMLARVREAVMEQSAVIHSAKLLRQLADFGENDSGRLEARVGHDDLLFAWGIALMSRSENYFEQGVHPVAKPAQGVQLYGVPMAEALEFDLEKHRLEVLHGKASQQRSYLVM